MMNPLDWKRDHQIALVCALGLGAIVGMAVGLAWSNPYTNFQWGALWCESGRNFCTYLLNGYWLRIIFWTALGATVGAALVYIRQLLRS